MTRYKFMYKSGKKLNNNFLYWLIGWYVYLRHPIKKPIDIAKMAEILTNEEK